MEPVGQGYFIAQSVGEGTGRGFSTPGVMISTNSQTPPLCPAASDFSG
jgi:hypothetical protein